MWTPATRAQHTRVSKRYQTDLSDAEWALIAAFVPEACTTGRRRQWPMREIVNAIFYVLRGGIAWRLLPKDFPPWQTVYRWFARFRDECLFERINHALVALDRERAGRDASPSAAIIDSQSVKTTESGGPRGYDAGKKIKGRKRHALVDTDGRPLLVEPHTADVQDRDVGGALLQISHGLFPFIEKVWADGGYNHHRVGVDAVLEEVLEGRGFGFDVERALFVATLHRLFVSGSDRACTDWMQSYAIDGTGGLALHHFYRAMAWLGEEIEEKADGALAARCVKDVIEEKLFDRRRDLFTDLSLVFMDTTSLSFYGAGGDTLGRRGLSKDHRPELARMILAVVIDAQGRPICTDMVPGNTADVKVLLPIVKRLRTRFGITRSCVVADRGMISAETIAMLEELGMEYILGARERSSKVVRDIVLNDTAPMIPLTLERQAGETQLGVKEVRVGSGKDTQRSIVTLNEAEAKKDKADRQAIIDGLQAQLKKGDKALVGNSAYRRYLKASGKTFEVDLGKLADEARFDGISVLRTNARITPLQAVIGYRDLLQVEALFQVAKASFDTRPIFHQSDAAIRGHVFVSFLALTLAKELTRLCQDKGFQPEWQPLLNDLDRLQQATIEKDGKVITTRTHVSGEAGNVFKAAGIALPANIAEQPAA